MGESTLTAENGTFFPHLGVITLTDQKRRSAPRRACPVCCTGLARDRDMLAIVRSGTAWWVCLSNLELGDEGCGFAYPRDMSWRRIRRLALERIEFLRDRNRVEHRVSQTKERDAT